MGRKIKIGEKRLNSYIYIYIPVCKSCSRTVAARYVRKEGKKIEGGKEYWGEAVCGTKSFNLTSYLTL